MYILNIFSFELYNMKKTHFSTISKNGKAALVELHEFKTVSDFSLHKTISNAYFD